MCYANNVRMVGNLNFVVEVFKIYWRPKLTSMIYYHFFLREQKIFVNEGILCVERFKVEWTQNSQKKVEYNF